MFFNPNALGHADNYIPANPLVTPAHIVPEWYLLPFYAVLRAIPDKFGGVMAMFASIGVLFVLPWLDTSRVRSMRYRPVMKIFFVLFVVNMFILGWCGAELPDAHVIGNFSTFTLVDGDLNSFLWLGRLSTLFYFAFFVVIMPLVGLREKPLPIPESISEPVLSSPVEAHTEKKG